MRSVAWETSAGALAALLNGATQAYIADLYTITLSGGSVIRYTSADMPVAANGNVYAIGPTIKRGMTKLVVGVTVDSLGITMAADSSVTVNGVPLIPFIAGGGLDGARVMLHKAYAAGPGGAWIGALELFSGRVSDVQASRYEASITVNSDAELLNVMVPRNVYQPGCGNTLFDGACGLSKSAWAVSVTATSTTDALKTTFSTAAGQAAGWFSLGFIVGVTGPNAGVRRTVKVFGSGVFQTIQPWPVAVAVGDTFTAYPGCDKLQTTCNAKFANLLRFRGHPYIPAPETIA